MRLKKQLPTLPYIEPCTEGCLLWIRAVPTVTQMCVG